MTRHNWQFWLTCLLLVMMYTALPISEAAAAGNPMPSVKLELTDQDDSIELTVAADNLTDMYAYDIVLSYDPALVQFLSSSTGLTGFFVNPFTGSVPGLNGKAKLATLIFKKISTGRTMLRLTQMKLVNSYLDLQTIDPEAKVEARISTRQIYGYSRSLGRGSHY
ncbi:hypothetical protein FHS18_000135 [Paenibacillus phyllosphaerae]|uniref:Cohesin domain-containing protein n=1 Tax=Paenibacillus phyllosphaerae TaxID=274593 RepID=A0A7W5AT27_9BACL|nr:cohesin domain-containing protein [Paenibacillus phyllosphaerae]MBB3108107.1 hypothetical protein [Paenibacillus phyllosphaerae]